jgi:RNA polymerase sigma-70 factor, ECF subfamily
MRRRATEFELFYAQHYSRVCGSLRTAFRDAQLAEDSTQEAFVRAFVRWPRVSRMERPAGWVWVVAVRVAYRRAGRAARVVELPPDPVPIADEIADRETLRLAIESLPDRQRVAIVLRYFADLPIADVARAMGCAPGTVKSTVHAALNRLNVELDDAVDLEEVQPDARG